MASLLTVTGCPPGCGGPAIRVLNSLLTNYPDPPGSYLALDNMKAWMAAFDMNTIPWNRTWGAYFSSDSDTSPFTQGLVGGMGFPNATYHPDAALPPGTALYTFQRVQCLFESPTNYLLLCVGWLDGYFGYYDEGCAGSAGGGCGIMEVPYSVIPGYPYVWLFLQGTSGYEVYPDLLTLVDNTYGPPDLSAGPDWNASQTCGPWHCCDPNGGQFSAPG